jgi:hypothetical protein
MAPMPITATPVFDRLPPPLLLLLPPDWMVIAALSAAALSPQGPTYTVVPSFSPLVSMLSLKLPLLSAVPVPMSPEPGDVPSQTVDAASKPLHCTAPELLLEQLGLLPVDDEDDEDDDEVSELLGDVVTEVGPLPLLV